MAKKKSKPKKRPVYYWDSNVFIALLTKEQRPFGEMQGVMSVADANTKKENTIMTSAVTRTEIFKDRDVNEDFKKVLQRSNVMEVALDPIIADRAGVVRKEVNQLYRAEKKQINTLDSIHLATAIIYEVEALHTFDEKDKASGKKSIKWLGLLQLSGKREVGGLRIEKPPVGQYILEV